MTDQEATIRRILERTRRIAVVGASPSPLRDSHGVVAALLDRGYDVVPVNPNTDEVLGQRSHPSLADVDGHLDLVDVFRRSEHLPDVARQVVERGGVGAVWNQLGLRSDEARRIVEGAGLDYVEDACLKVAVRRLSAELDLPPAA